MIFFTKMDHYYSQGIHLELVHPGLRSFPLNKLLFTIKRSSSKYGLALDHMAFTPTSISSDNILYGDRPYAATISLKYFNISTDAVRRRQLSSNIILGMIGPAAFGKEMQTGIHRWLKNPLPKGWQYQIQNDIILQYQVNYEQSLWHPGRAFLVSGTAEGIAGTFQQQLNGGFILMTGHFNDPYQNNVPAKNSGNKWQYYFYAKTKASLVGYDAGLQGGLFNRKNPYTISAGQISRGVLQADAGITVSHRSIYFTYSQSVITKEFKTGNYHRWGGLRLGVVL